MCGLAGLMRLDGRVTAEDVGAVLRMLDAQDHRGPDDWGLLLPDAAARSRELGPLLGRLDPAHVMTYPGRELQLGERHRGAAPRLRHVGRGGARPAAGHV